MQFQIIRQMKKQKIAILTQENIWSVKTDSYMIQVLKLPDKDYKATILTVFENIKKNMTP